MIPERLTARLALEVRDEALAQAHARQLTALRFEVSGCGPRGVNFSGPTTLFVETFGEIVESPTGVQFAKNPVLPPELRTHVDSIYFPTKPTYLEREVSNGRQDQSASRSEVFRG